MTPSPADSIAEPLLAVACPHCQAALSVGTDLVRCAARCPLCGGGFLVPEPQAFPTEPPPRMGLDAVVADLPLSTEAPTIDPAMQFAEPARTIDTPEGTITLRRLTAKEKSARRARRNLVMLIGGLAVLLTIVFVFGTSPKTNR